MTQTQQESDTANGPKKTTPFLPALLAAYICLLSLGAFEDGFLSAQSSLLTLISIALVYWTWQAAKLRREATAHEKSEALEPTRRKRSARDVAVLLLAAFLLLRIGRGLVGWGIIDTLEADTATSLAVVSLAALVSGMRIQDNWLRHLRFFLILTTAFGSSMYFLKNGGSAVLTGNSGYDFQIVLPGACLALWHLVRETEGLREVSWIAVLSTAAFAAFEPVVGGAVVFATCMAFVSFLPRGRNAPKLARPLARLGAGLLLFGVSTSMSGTATNPVDALDQPSTSAPLVDPTASETDQSSNELGGVGVRTSIWGTMPSLVATYPMGLGTGQFQALYPPFRDPHEIELTSHNRELEEVFEVEHPHNDLLFAFAEQGIAGGALFGLGWLAAAIGLFAFIVRKEEDEPHATPTDRERQGFAFAGLALLAVSLFHAPLLYNFLAGPLVFFLLGIALKTTPTRFAASKSDGARNPALLVFAVLGLLASQVPNAWSLTKHNEALWPINGPYLDVGAKAALVRPDSFQANASAARRCDKRRARSVLAAESQSPELVAGGPDDSIPYWTAALRVRPHSIEALSNIGRVYASRGAFDEALVHWNHARELDPGYPVVLRNLRRLGADLVLSGKLDAGLRELAPHLSLEEAVDENGNPIDVGSNLLNESQRESDPLLASALLCAAQWTWAREHAAAGNFDYAVRSYRQARRELQREPLHSAPELDFEYGAALRLGGRQTEAADIWAALGDTQVLQSASPQWAAEAFDLD